MSIVGRIMPAHPGVVFAIVAVVIFRMAVPLAGGETAALLANISPLAAVIVCSAIHLPRRAALLVPFGALLLSTAAVNLVRGWPVANIHTLISVAGFAAVFALGWAVRGRRGALPTLAAVLAGSVLYYFISNTGSFFFDPGYAKTWAGWWQCLTVGLPQYPPTWTFLLRSVAGDLVFAGLFLLCCRRSRRLPLSRPLPQTA